MQHKFIELMIRAMHTNMVHNLKLLLQQTHMWTNTHFGKRIWFMI